MFVRHFCMPSIFLTLGGMLLAAAIQSPSTSAHDLVHLGGS